MRLLKSSKFGFLYLLLLSFVFISTSALAMFKISGKTGFSTGRQPLEGSRLTKNLAPLPVLKEGATFPLVSAQSALAVDLDSYVTLYEKDPDLPFYPASTTKIITSLVAIDHYPFTQVLSVGDEVKVGGQKMGLVRGEEVKVVDLLYGLLIFSANDAAEVLAKNFPGGKDAFIAAMNAKARQLNLGNSSFANPTGLDGEGQVTTARDLIRMSDSAMDVVSFKEIVRIAQKDVKSIDGRVAHKLVNTNELLGQVEGVLGVKTGWTESARENLVTYIERDGRRIMIALLGSQDRFGETKELIEWIFGSYRWQEVRYPN